MAKVFAMLVAALLFWPSIGQNGGMYRTQNGIIRFSSDAPLELIEAASDELKGVFDPTRNRFAFRVETKSFKGFNSRVQQTHFNENYLESSRYPTAVFSGKIIEKKDFRENGLYFVRAKGELELHGIKRERIIRCTLKVNDGKMTLRSRFSVFLEDHGIDVPRVIQQKIATEIVVDVEAELFYQ